MWERTSDHLPTRPWITVHDSKSPSLFANDSKQKIQAQQTIKSFISQNKSFTPVFYGQTTLSTKSGRPYRLALSWGFLAWFIKWLHQYDVATIVLTFGRGMLCPDSVCFADVKDTSVVKVI